MRVRIRQSPRGYWVVESKEWWQFSWTFEESFHGDASYDRAYEYARKVKAPYCMEVT